MTDQTADMLPDEALLALAHTGSAQRDALTMFFELDLRLARIVSATSEPMLGQMRLAWWRDMLASPPNAWPKGDQVLDGIKEHWEGRQAYLVPLVDGWEYLLAEPPLGPADADAFATGRATALVAAFGVSNEGHVFDHCLAAAHHWALADLAAKVSLDEERAMLVDLALTKQRPSVRLPSNCRGLAVLGALGLRALKRGGQPLMQGRGASLVALRAAITRR